MSEEENEIFFYAAEGCVNDLEKHIKKHPSSLHCKDHRIRTPLFHAALTDREKNAQFLIKKGLSWWDEDANSATALHWATQSGSIRVIRMILQNGKTLSGVSPCLQKDKDGVTPIHIAARRPSDKVLKLLVESLGSQEKLEAKALLDSKERSPLHYAAASCSFECCQYLIDSPTLSLLVDQKDVYRQTPLMCAAGVRLPQALHLAVAADNIPVLDALLNELQAAIIPDNDFRTPLHYGADFGNIAAIERLLEKGVKNEKDKYGVYCAHYAAQNNATAMALLLRAPNGKIREVKDKENRSCFMWAVVAGNVDAIEFLLQNCPPARNEIDSHGLTALHLAALMGNERVCKILIKQGWHLTGGDGNFPTPMHLAAGRGHTLVVSSLVTAGADMKATDPMERTAIFPACFGGQAHTLYVMIRELGFEWRATVDNQVRPIADAMGRTPLHAAAYAGFSHCITQMLKIEEEDPTALAIPLVGAVDHNGETALHVAAGRGRLDCVLVLLNNGAAINALDNNLRTPYQHAQDASQKAVADHLRHEGALTYDELREMATRIIQNWILEKVRRKKEMRKRRKALQENITNL